jgi:hypothetical protein
MQDRPEHGITKRAYAEAVLTGVEAFHAQHSTLHAQSSAPGAQTPAEKQPLIVRLLLSIDRRESAEAALDTVRTLRHRFHHVSKQSML